VVYCELSISLNRENWGLQSEKKTWARVCDIEQAEKLCSMMAQHCW